MIYVDRCISRKARQAIIDAQNQNNDDGFAYVSTLKMKMPTGDSKFIKGGFGMLLEEHMNAIVRKKALKKTPSTKSFSINSQDEMIYETNNDSYMFLETSVKRLSVK